MPLRALAFIMVLCLSPGVAAAQMELGAAIDQAGRLRMLSQRIVKAYCQIGLGLEREAAAQQLADALKRFDAAMQQLQLLAEVPAVGHAIEPLQSAWVPFRALASGPVSRKGAAQLDVQGERVLEAAHALVERLQARSARPHARYVNLAGRQRMLTQRMAKLYLLRLYGDDSAALREQLAAARRDFYAALSMLQVAPQNTAEIMRELQAVSLQWEWLRTALLADGARTYAAGIAGASEQLLERLDRVTAWYAALPAAAQR